MPQFGGLELALSAVWAVVPIIPALEAIWLLAVAAVLSLLTAVASLRHPRTALQLLHLLWRQRLPVSLLLIGGFGTFWLVAWSLDRVRSGTATLSRPGNEVPGPRAVWPTARGSVARRGVAPEADVLHQALGPDQAGLRWRWRRGDEAFYSSPAVGEDHLFIVGSRGDRGTIHCVDVASGERLWSCRPPGMRATFSSPVTDGRYLVCGEGLHSTRQARVICIDLRTRRLAWTFATRGHVECTPAITGERVFVGAGDDGVYCLDLRPEVKATQRLIWHQPGEKFPDAETSLAVHEGRVYVGLGVGGEAICVLDAETGRELGRRRMPYPVFSPPTIWKDRLIVGMGSGDYVTPARERAGQVVCLARDDLRVLWTFATAGTVLGAVATIDDQFIFGCWDGSVHVLDQHGRQLGHWRAGAPVAASPAVTREHIYVVHGGGELIALRRETMRPVWRERLGTRGRFVSSPVVAGGSIVVGTEFDGLLRVGRRAPDAERRMWPSAGGGAGYAGCRDGSPLPHAPRLAWTWPASPPAGEAESSRGEAESSRGEVASGGEVVPPTEENKTILAAPPAAAGDHLVVPVAAGPMRGVVCLPLEQTVASSEPPAPRWRHELPAGVHQSPLILGSRVFVVDGRSETGDRRLRCLDLKTGEERWSVPLELGASGRMSGDGEGIVVQHAPEKIARFSLTGRRLWTRSVGELSGPVHTGPARLVAATANPPRLLALDTPTGRSLWSESLAERPTTGPVADDPRIILGTDRGLRCFSLLDGQLLKGPAGDSAAVQPPIYVGPLGIIFATSDGRLHVRRRSDLQPVAVLDKAYAAAGLLVGGDGLLVAAGNSLWRADASDWRGSFSRWSLPAEVGIKQADGTTQGPAGATTCLVLHGGCLYLCLPHQLICLRPGSEP